MEVTWRYEGFDDVASRVETPVSFVREADEVRIAGIGGEAPETTSAVPGAATQPAERLRTPPWLAGPVAVARDDELMVVAAESAARGDRGLDEYAALAADAVAPSREEVPDWDGRLVVEVPEDTAGLAAALGAPADSVAAVAAVTAAPDGSTSDDAAVHVYLHAAVFDGLGERGARLVMAHEAVHVATRAPASAAPVWLVEGFADLVAVRAVGVSEDVAAAQVARRVRTEGTPEALPTPEDFDTTTGHVGATYEAAWVACLVLAEEAGEDAVQRVYTRTDAGEDLATVLPEEADLSVDALTGLWQQRLETLSDRAA